MLNEALRHVVRMAKHDYLVYVVTDFSGADDETRDLMTRLAWHNDVIATMVFDEIESRLPDAGGLVFAGSEGQLEVNTSDARIRERYAKVFDDMVGSIRDTLLKRAVPVIPIDAGWPVPEQVQRHIGSTVSGRRRKK
jgi:hypothetical protein